MIDGTTTKALNDSGPPISDWLKVKIAAVLGMVSTSMPSVLEQVGPLLDIVIKLGQIGVAAVTIGYIYTKWRKARSKK